VRILFAGRDADLVMQNSGEDRKPGLHLSDITGRMAYEKDRKLNPDIAPDKATLDRGFTWETVLERSLSARHKRIGYRPEQLQEDGIWLSPDWVNPDDPDAQHEEWKSTKKSSKYKFDDQHWHWMPSTMAYLRALLKRGIVHSLVTRFRVWYINGDYSYESKSSDRHLFADYWRFDVAFEKRELEENWQRILTAGRRYGLLKGDGSWVSPTTTERKRDSKGRKTLPAMFRASTSPSTKGSSKLRPAS
jgi:hypothetical protein